MLLLETMSETEGGQLSQKPTGDRKPDLSGVKAIMFDLDGTLIRSAIDFKKLKRRTIDFLSSHGLPTDSFSEQMRQNEIVSKGVAMLTARGVAKSECAVIALRATEIWNQVELEAVHNTSVLKGAEETLQKLKRRGVKVGVVTRGCRAYAVEAMKVTGLLSLVDVIVARDESANPKPDPEQLTKALEMLGLREEEAVMVGDSPLDVQCAKSAGVRFIGVLTGISTREMLERAGCTTILTDVEELPALIG